MTVQVETKVEAVACVNKTSSEKSIKNDSR